MMTTKMAWMMILVSCLQLFGCGDFAGWMRQYTYPPGFHYISSEELRSTMWQLAYHSRELNRLLNSASPMETRRDQILQHLDGMERAAVELNRGGWPSNHPLIDENRSNFLRDIRMAKETLQREPPNFLLAGSVTGACIYCHGSRLTE